ncbi:MAG: bifunctional riboflavin kinase/FAD synthetase [Clostridiales bacterium]|nr:bifunctional riboflavin kinase/FAD synthetase [Clostridiales bacterium]HBM81221.1 bifunctional riboflavin kinase/FAD synthetase [Clostridiaceae bacterium]
MNIIMGDIDDRAFSNIHTACALGFFDGVHIGHQNLIRVLKDMAFRQNQKTVVFTFEKHPMTILNKGKAPELITSNSEKARIIGGLGIDILYFTKVDEGFLNMQPEDFINDILIKKFNVSTIVTGFNFRFGKNGRGDCGFLMKFCKERNIRFKVVEPVSIDGMIVSSTLIRELIKNGNIKTANKLLGRHYLMEGRVIHGKRRGHLLGFPTANIDIDKGMIAPKNGVYITKTEIDGTLKAGITNIGYNPTFGNKKISVETNIMGFDSDIYGKYIRLYFYDMIREEIKFNNISELKNQISHDKDIALKYSE